MLSEQGSRQLSAFVCIHQPDGFKDLFTGDFCCRRLFILPGLRCCRGQVLGIEVRFDLLGQLQPGLVLRVGVGVHQDRCRCMTCVALHRLEVTVRLQKLVGGTGVPLRYNYDKPEKPRRIKGFEVFSLVFSSFSKPKNHTEISRIIGGVSLTTNE